MRVFLAGASGVIGVRLLPLLLGAGHTVAGMTRSAEKARRIAGFGAEPVVCDVYDRDALVAAVVAFRPDLVMDQLTDLPDQAEDIQAFAARNSRMRTEGTGNLLDAANAAGVHRFLAQSIAWRLPHNQESVDEHERLVLDDGGVVLRYGQLYGPGTYFEQQMPPPPRIQIDEAARRTVPLLGAESGVIEIVED